MQLHHNSAFKPRTLCAAMAALCLAAALGVTATGEAFGAVQEQEPEKKQSKQEIEGPSTTITVEETIREIPTENTSAAKIALPLRELPIKVGVVSGAVIRSQAAVTMGEALTNVAGVNVHNGFGVFDFFTVRGFDNLTTGLILTDGAIEPESTFYQMYNIERVEVLKGPSSYLYGINSLAGTVNLIRKQPIFESNFADVGVFFGGFETYQGDFDINWVDPSGAFAFRLNGMYQDSENFRDDKASRLGAFNPAFTWRMNDRSQLTVNFEFVDNEYSPDNGIPLFNNQIPDVDRERSFQSPLDRSKQRIHRFRVDWNLRLNDTVSFHNKFYTTSLDWISDGTLFGGAFPNPETGGVEAIRILSQLDDLQRFTGNQSEFLLSFRTGALRHQVVAGVEVGHFTDDFTLMNSFLPPIDLFNPVETARPEFLVPIPQTAQTGDARSLTFAPYVVDKITFSDYLHIFVGGRFDLIDHQDEAVDLDRTDRNFSPLAGIVVSPADRVSFFANAGQAFRPPSTLTQAEDRDPEESTQYEFGLKSDFLDERLTASLSYYHLERQNIAIPDDLGVTQQTGDQRSRGIELEMAAELLPQWYAFFSYAFNDAELTEFREVLQIPAQPPIFSIVDRSGNDPAFAPDHLFNLWTMKEFASGLGLGFGARYVSEQFIAEDNAFEIDDYVVLDAMVSYRRTGWRLAVNFRNLTDAEYETRGFGAFSVTPANPFSVTGSIRYTFGF